MALVVTTFKLFQTNRYANQLKNLLPRQDFDHFEATENSENEMQKKAVQLISKHEFMMNLQNP